MGKAHLEIVKRALIEQIKDLTSAIDSLKGELMNESKSALGDKHETARAKMQLEMERLAALVANKERELNKLSVIRFNEKQSAVQKGSLVKTDIGTILIAIAFGKIADHGFMAISDQAPMAKKLMGLEKGERLEMNGKFILIQEID
ncbi:MAG: hypothetical protein AAF487_08100 [Bacteroidota bacterium]